MTFTRPYTSCMSTLNRFSTSNGNYIVIYAAIGKDDFLGYIVSITWTEVLALDQRPKSHVIYSSGSDWSMTKDEFDRFADAMDLDPTAMLNHYQVALELSQ